MIQSGHISIRSKSESARSPYVRFGGVVELCSQLGLVVAVRRRDKQKGSISVFVAPVAHIILPST